jgi:hypothetical protein
MAKRLMNSARKGESLIGVSDNGLFGPHQKTELKNHEALCRVLTEHFDIPIALPDFFDEWDERDPGYSINPLEFARVERGSRLLVVTCCYLLEKRAKKKSRLVFTIEPTSVEFHLLESASAMVS